MNRGDFVQPASTMTAKPLLTVARTDMVRIFVDVPEMDSPWVEAGRAGLRQRAGPSRPDRGRKGDADQLGPGHQSDLAHGTGPSQSERPAAAGDVCHGAHRSPGASRCFVLPSSAVVREGKQAFCWVVAGRPSGTNADYPGAPGRQRRGGDLWLERGRTGRPIAASLAPGRAARRGGEAGRTLTAACRMVFGILIWPQNASLATLAKLTLLASRLSVAPQSVNGCDGPVCLDDFGLATPMEWLDVNQKPRTNALQNADDASAGRLPQRQVPTLSANLPGQRAALAAVAGLLFLSGMCGLIFQVSWFREFRLVFGASTAASSAVLAVFMGGLGIGNAVLGKRADRARSPLALYALLELSIAVAAALGPLLIDVLHGLYISLGGQLALGFSLATAVRLAISALVLGVPTFLMGGTLPAAVRAVTVCEDHQRRGAAVLYGVNTLGAVAGALGSTFFALEFFGTRKTLWLACLRQPVHGTVRAGALHATPPAAAVQASDAADCRSESARENRKLRPLCRATHGRPPGIVPGVHRLCRGRRRRLRLLPHGTRLVPHAWPDSRRDHLHVRVDTGRGIGGHRAGRGGLCRVLPPRAGLAPRPGLDQRPGGVLHRDSLRLGRSPGDSGGHASRGQRIAFPGRSRRAGP